MKRSRIYIADQRGITKNAELSVFSTFNWGKYEEPVTRVFGALKYANEVRSDQGGELQLFSEGHTYQLVIPLYGELKIKGLGLEHTVEIGKLWCLSTDKAIDLTISSADENEPYFSFIQLTLTSSFPLIFHSETWHLDIDRTHDRMISITGQDYPFSIYMGAFFKKEVFKFDLPSHLKNIFLLTLEGACEVEDKLLYAGDALTIEHVSEVEIECLSSYAILLALALRIPHQTMDAR